MTSKRGVEEGGVDDLMFRANLWQLGVRPKTAWEAPGLLMTVLGDNKTSPVPRPKFEWPEASIMDSQVLEKDAAEAAERPAGSKVVKKGWLKASAASKAWRDSLDEARTAALQMWKVLQSGDATRLGRILQTVESDSELHTSLRDTFAGKATSTLKSRAGSLLVFSRWKASVEGRETVAIFPLLEKDAYEYLCHSRREGAPRSRIVKFVESVGFARGLLGADVEAVLSSPSVKGACAPTGPPQPTRKKVPLTVLEITLLERMAHAADPYSQDAIIAGFVCVVLHCRLRWSDAMHMESEPVLDLFDQVHGFFEGKLHSHKTAAAMNFRLLPVVAILPGVSGLNWATKYLENRKKQRLTAGPRVPFQPAPLSWGGWAAFPFDSTLGSVWLREKLKAANPTPERLLTIATHSLKATLLSWMSRAPAPGDIQRRAGYHLSAGERNPAEYERDGQTAVLHFLQGMLVCVVQGFFSPDAQRSGRWSGCRSVDEGMAIIAGQSAVSDGPKDETEARSDDGEESEISELGEACHSEAEQAAAEEVVTKVSRCLGREERSDDDHVAFRHLFSGVVHLAKREGPDFEGEIQAVLHMLGVGLQQEESCVVTRRGGARGAVHETMSLVDSATEYDTPRKLPTQELAARLELLQKQIRPLIIKDRLEPSHALINAAAQMVEDSRVKYIPWVMCTTRGQEINAVKELSSMKVWQPDKHGMIREVERGPAMQATVGSELEVHQALRRRGIAYAVAQVMSFT
ncbi:unnamed protein product, partial [Symbiodinium microadriaticum]